MAASTLGSAASLLPKLKLLIQISTFVFLLTLALSDGFDNP